MPRLVQLAVDSDNQVMQTRERHATCRVRISVPSLQLPEVRPGDPRVAFQDLPRRSGCLATQGCLLADATKEVLEHPARTRIGSQHAREKSPGRAHKLGL